MVGWGPVAYRGGRRRGGLGVGGGGVLVVRGGGGEVGVMRRSEAGAMVEWLELGDGADIEAWRKQSPVLCSSGDGR